MEFYLIDNYVNWTKSLGLETFRNVRWNAFENAVKSKNVLCRSGKWWSESLNFLIIKKSEMQINGQITKCQVNFFALGLKSSKLQTA